jgi:HK97 family phage prohead protease
MIPRTEVRMVTTELRDVQAVGKPYRFLEGRAVPFNVFADIAGLFLEAHAMDSFKRSTRGGSGKNLPLLLFHDHASSDGIAGHSESWDNRPDGLHGVWRLNDAPETQKAIRLVLDNDLSGLSIGFQPVRSDYQFADEYAPERGPEYMDKVIRTESRLLEVSLTPTPAFATAGVTNIHTEETRESHLQTRSRLIAPRVRDVDIWRLKFEELRSK